MYRKYKCGARQGHSYRSTGSRRTAALVIRMTPHSTLSHKGREVGVYVRAAT